MIPYFCVVTDLKQAIFSLRYVISEQSSKPPGTHFAATCSATISVAVLSTLTLLFFPAALEIPAISRMSISRAAAGMISFL